MSAARTRALFVNSGILGHRAVAALVADAAARIPDLDAVHVNLSEDLTISDRIVRRVLCARIAPGNLDFARWRRQMNEGLLASRRIAAAERDGCFAVLHFHTQAAAYASLGRMRSTPAIVSIDATEHLASLESPSAVTRATFRPNIARDGQVFRAARAIVSTSSWAARDLADVYPDCAAKVRVMPYPVRADRFPADWPAARVARARADAAPLRVLFMGGDFPRKGGPLLLQAWREADFGDRATLDIVTDWPLERSSLPAGARVVTGITPYTPEWFQLWRDADVFAMPTRHEAYGLVFQEAAAAGIPAIGTSINAVPEIVADGTTGLLVPAGDLAALVLALKTLAAAPELRIRMGAAARDRVRATSSIERYSNALHAVIEDVRGRDVHRT